MPSPAPGAASCTKVEPRGKGSRNPGGLIETSVTAAVFGAPAFCLIGYGGRHPASREGSLGARWKMSLSAPTRPLRARARPLSFQLLTSRGKPPPATKFRNTSQTFLARSAIVVEWRKRRVSDGNKRQTNARSCQCRSSQNYARPSCRHDQGG